MAKANTASGVKAIHDEVLHLIDEAQEVIAEASEAVLTFGVTTQAFQDGILQGHLLAAYAQLETAKGQIKNWIEKTPAELRRQVAEERTTVLKALLEDAKLLPASKDQPKRKK